MKAASFLTFIGSSLAVSSTGTATDKRSESGHLNHFIPNGIPSVRLGDLKLPDGQPISEGLPIPSDLPVPIGLPNKTTPLPFPGSIESDAPGNKSIHHRRQLFGMTENGVTMSTGCQPLTFIFARGTGEPGNMGIVVGPPVASALRSLTGSKVAVQGVNYDASVMVCPNLYFLHSHMDTDFHRYRATLPQVLTADPSWHNTSNKLYRSVQRQRSCLVDTPRARWLYTMRRMVSLLAK